MLPETRDFLSLPYDGWVAAFTGVLTLATIGLWVSTRRLAKLGRDEFNATHRPKIKVRYVRRFNPNGEFWSVSVTIVNVGSGVAIIDSIDIEILSRVELRRILRRRGYADILTEGRPPAFERREIASGDSRVAFANSSLRATLASKMEEDEMPVVLGRISYRDGRNLVRNTGFVWDLIRDENLFGPRDDRELAYED